jgi:hypothetical protein
MPTDQRRAMSANELGQGSPEHPDKGTATIRV